MINVDDFVNLLVYYATFYL